MWKLKIKSFFFGLKIRENICTVLIQLECTRTSFLCDVYARHEQVFIHNAAQLAFMAISSAKLFL